MAKRKTKKKPVARARTQSKPAKPAKKSAKRATAKTTKPAKAKKTAKPTKAPKKATVAKKSSSRSKAAVAKRPTKQPVARPRKPEPKRSAPATRPKTSSAAPPEGTPTLIPVPLPGVVHQSSRAGDTSERSAHLDKLKQLFETAPVSRFLGMTLGYCENGVARVRLPFRKEFVEGHGVIHGGLIGLLGDTAGNFAVGSVSPGSTVKTVEFKLSLLSSVQGDLLAIGEVVRKGRTLATCRLEVVEGNDRVVAIGLATYALQAI